MVLGRQRAAIENSVEEDAEGTERLPSPLRSKAEQKHMAVAVVDVERRRVALEMLGAQEVSREQRRAGFLVRG